MAWRYGGHDPFKLFHGLGDDYCPWAGGPEVRPGRPDRLRNLYYGYAMQAQVEAIEFARASRGG